MKKSKLKLLTKILAIVIICLVSFIGIYVQKYNKMENIIKQYEYTKDLSGYRQIMFEISEATEVLDSEGKVIGNTDQYDDETIKSNKYKKSKTAVNKEEALNKENYELSKKIIENRLDLMGIEDYTLSLEKETGKMYLQIPEDSNTDRVVSNIIETGSFEIKDSEDNTIYLTNKNLKKASAMYNTTETGTTVYIHMQLDKEGTAVLKELSENQYATVPESNDENTTSEEEQKNETSKEETGSKKDDKKDDKKDNKTEEVKQKQITLAISGNNVVTTSFDEPIYDGVIDLSMNASSTDNNEINETLKTTSTIVTLLESGNMPLVYKVTINQYVTTDISSEFITDAVIIVGTVLAILLVFMIIKNKLKGLLGVISYIGFVATYLLLIRYTNVEISISGGIAIILVLLINYILNMKLLNINNEDNKQFKQEYIKFIMKMIPLLIIAIVFIFMKWVPLSSLGMLLFWGISLMIIYNILITNKIIK